MFGIGPLHKMYPNYVKKKPEKHDIAGFSDLLVHPIASS
jgi:hypothetical protein